MPEPHRALVVVDVQHEYVDGALPIVHPALTTSLAAIGAALDAAAGSLPVVVIRHEDEAGSPVFAAGSAGAELAEPVASAHADVTIVKHAVSAFAGTGLAAELAARGIDTVTLAGFMTHFCVESTARDAADLGLAVEVLSDATGTLAIDGLDARSLHERTLAVLAGGFAAVAPTEEWVAAVASGAPLPEPDLLASVRVER